MKPEPKKILIVDDHAIFREGLRLLIRHWDDFQVVGEVNNGKAALEFCRKHPPDIILMDVDMPGMGGVEATWHITEQFPAVVVVMLTMLSDEQSLFLAIKAGARGYVLKNSDANQLHNTIRRIVNGEEVLTSSLASKVLLEFKQLRSPQPNIETEEDRFQTLTERETQILQLIADGLTNAEIGDRLFLSDETIKKQISDILHKLHLNNRAQLAAYGLRKGLIS